MSVKNYFDLHSHHHAYHKQPGHYEPIMNYLKNFQPNKRKKILDFGCGDGFFIETMIKSGINGKFYGLDLSTSMISLANKKFPNNEADLFIADGFMLPLKEDFKLDIIHIDAVLHHIIENTRKKSLLKVEKIIDQLVKKLSENGILIVEEMNYVSYVFPSLTAFCIFYGLKFLNFFKIDLGKLSTEIKLGLEVNFFYDKQLKKFLEKYGNVEQIRKKVIKSSKRKHLLLLKEQGPVAFAVRI